MKKRLDDPNVISGETVYNMLLSFREIQDYDAMVNLVDTLEFLKSIHNYKNCVNTPAIMYLYAFALNRYVGTLQKNNSFNNLMVNISHDTPYMLQFNF